MSQLSRLKSGHGGIDVDIARYYNNPTSGCMPNSFFELKREHFQRQGKGQFSNKSHHSTGRREET